jgi:HlyD family secretion protein
MNNNKRHNMKKYVKIALLAIVAIMFLGTFVFLYQKSQPVAIVYEVLNVSEGDLERTTVATGKIEPRDEILIKPQISGIIDVVYKEAGEAVKKGEVIAKVKVIPELGTLNSAESRVRLAEINARQSETDFGRMKKLFEEKLVSSEEFERSEVSVKQAREELQTAKDNLEIVKEGITKNSASFSSTLIRSTIDGLILDVPIKEGNSVIMSNTFNDGTTIATVADMNDLIFRGNIDETEVGQLNEGIPVKITLGALQNMESQDNEVFAKTKEGMELIYNKLIGTLTKKGLKPINAKGEMFDENLHEAIARIPAQNEDEKGKVIDETTKGYYLNDKVIRYSKVVVAM